MLSYAFLKSTCVAALGVAILAFAPAAEAGSTAVGGKRMSCGAAKVVWSTQYNYNGYAKPGQIFLNPRILRTYPPATRQFIFLHECAHQYVGYNRTEQAADCWAVRRGKRRGWLADQVKVEPDLPINAPLAGQQCASAWRQAL